MTDQYYFACPHCGQKVTLSLQILSKTAAGKLPPKQAKLLTPPDTTLDADLADLGYTELLTVADVDGALCYTPKRYLDKDVWTEINEVMRHYGGKWIPGAGDERHWEVPTP